MSLTPRGASDVPDVLATLAYAICDGTGNTMAVWPSFAAAADDAREWLGYANSIKPIAIVPLVRLDSAQAAITALTTRSAALEAEKAELTARFEKYGDHLPGCPSRVYIASWDACTCGFNEIRVASSPSLAERTE